MTICTQCAAINFVNGRGLIFQVSIAVFFSYSFLLVPCALAIQCDLLYCVLFVNALVSVASLCCRVLKEYTPVFPQNLSTPSSKD